VRPQKNGCQISNLKKIDELIAHLDSTTSKKFVLFSTVDVFKNPIGVDESTPVDELGLCAYGLHRRLLEKYVEAHFEDHLIVRLPGLVGPGLRKNIIFDFLNANNIDTIDSRGIFQFYPMVNLWYDIQTALNAGLKIVHLTSEPISVAEISLQGFGKHFFQIRGDSPITYDFRTLYAGIFGGIGGYQYGQREIIQAIRNYAQSQVRTLNWGESKRS